MSMFVVMDAVPFEGADPVCVFASREEAERWIAAHPPEPSSERYAVEVPVAPTDE